MKNNLHKSFILIFIMVAMSMYGNGVEEQDIESPIEVNILPEKILGKFIIPVIYDDIELIIYRSNKYIINVVGNDYTSTEYGHIIMKDENYYLSPIKKGLIKTASQLNIVSDSFYFLTDENIKLKAYRAKTFKISPESMDITFTTEIMKDRNFIIRSSEDRVREINYIDTSFKQQLYLDVTAGKVFLTLDLGDGSISYKGSLSLEETSDNSFRGLIHFTNGAAISYIPKGIAVIEKNDKIVTIRFECNSSMLDSFKSLGFKDAIVIESEIKFLIKEHIDDQL